MATFLWYRSAYDLPADQPLNVILPRPNGDDTLAAAGKQLVPEVDGVRSYPRLKDDPWPLAGRKKLLAANAPALAKARIGLGQLSYVTPDLPDRDASKARGPLRDLTRLLACAATTHAQEGDLAAAARDASDAIALGMQAAVGGGLMDNRVGESCEAIGQKALWERVADRARAVWFQGRIVYYGPKTTMANTDRWIDALEARSTTAWSNPRPTPPLPADPLSDLLAPMYDQGEFSAVRTRAFATLLETYLALRAYRLERGAYPATLAELTANGYRKALPVDPFSPTRAPLGYRRLSADRMLLWSVGPDAKDDGGRAIESRRRGYVTIEQPGDIVTRVNTQ